MKITKSKKDNSYTIENMSFGKLLCIYHMCKSIESENKLTSVSNDIKTAILQVIKGDMPEIID